MRHSLCLTLLMQIGGVCSAQTGTPTTSRTWENSLGCRFLPVPGTTIKMCIWETRVKDFAAFAEATGYNATDDFYYYKNRSWHQGDRNWKEPGFVQTDDHPICGINWRDAIAFCDWLTETERAKGIISNDQAYRLPSEEEWSLAAGADLTPPFPEYFANYHQALEFESFEYTAPVGTFTPNTNGFFDMSGNVWEYCLDTYDYTDEYRVIRGGCWQNWHAKFVGMSARGRCSPDIRITLYGFRLVLAPEDEVTMEMRNAAKKAPSPKRELLF